MQVNREINILVVDDFSTMRKIVKDLLRELGFHHFDEADDGATAWPMVQTGKYDFISKFNIIYKNKFFFFNTSYKRCFQSDKTNLLTLKD